MNQPDKVPPSASSDLLEYLTNLIRTDEEASVAYKKEKVRLSLSEALKKIRIMNKLDQKALALRMKKTQGWVSKIESPNNDHTLESITEYLFHLNMDLKISIDYKGCSFGIVDSKEDQFQAFEANLPEFLSLAENLPREMSKDEPADWSLRRPPDSADVVTTPSPGIPNDREAIKKWWEDAA